MSHLPKILVAGLGNLPYPNTRHSIGQLIIDQLSSRTGIRLSSDRDGLSGESVVTLGNTPLDLTLFKSKHLMNVSGPSIVSACKTRGLPPNMLIVISDSSDHEPCTVRYRFGGSANGHNGLKSIISAFGSQGFHRLRIGIGRHPNMALSDYVLGKLSSHERQYWSAEGLDLVCDEIEKIAMKANP
ncbi:peptidyl-tRNA hydrolase [Favolaschia claudopus]|uniref:peptidyl-tRNA hydrolase n=1 Tax=Favolaschia claudopus TaxID=2862362 RepID=A0AAW0AB59_9AGAR